MTIQNTLNLYCIQSVTFSSKNLCQIQLFIFFNNEITPKKEENCKKFNFSKKIFFHNHSG